MVGVPVVLGLVWVVFVVGQIGASGKCLRK